MSKFFDSLKPDGLVFAGNLATRLYHIVKLRTSAYDDDVNDLSKHLNKASRARKIAEIQPRRKELWNGTALCGVRGETANWGNYNRYYWDPKQDPSLDGVCKGCQKAWKKLGEPEITGYDRSITNADAWPWDLPFGWHEMPAASHPWDVSAGSDPEQVKDDTGKIVGELRIELRRFQRGPRIVRLVHHLDTDTYSARHWTVKGSVDDEKWKVRGTFQHAREYCHQLMARGGY